MAPVSTKSLIGLPLTSSVSWGSLGSVGLPPAPSCSIYLDHLHSSVVAGICRLHPCVGTARPFCFPVSLLSTWGVVTGSYFLGWVSLDESQGLLTGIKSLCAWFSPDFPADRLTLEGKSQYVALPLGFLSSSMSCS